MSLLAYNLTVLPLPLAAGAPIVSLPASLSAGSRGPAMNVTGELKGLPAIGGFDLLQAQVAAGDVQYEWSGLPEYNTFSLVVGSAQTDLSDLPVNIYVGNWSAQGGTPGLPSDSNPGTIDNPLATFDAAWNKQPAHTKNNPFIIHMAAGLYAAEGKYYANCGTLGTAPGNDACPVQVRGTVVDSGLGPLLGVAVPDNNLNYAAPIVTVPGAWRGAFLRNTDTDQRACISDNQTVGPNTVFSLNADLNSGAGANFVIEKPASNIVIQNGTMADFINQGASFLGFQDVLFSSPPGGGFTFLIRVPDGSRVKFNACEFDWADGFFLGLNIAHGSQVVLQDDITGDHPGWGRAGAFMHSSVVAGFFGNDMVQIRGHLVGDNLSFGFGEMCDADLQRVSVRHPTSPFNFFNMNQGANMRIHAGDMDGCDVSVGGNSYGQFGNANGGQTLNISNSPNSGVTVVGSTFIDCFALIGSGNGGAGISVQGMSQAVINSFGTATTITGSAPGVNDLLVGAVPLGYAALLPGPVGFSEQGALAPFMPTLNRVVSP